MNLLNDWLSVAFASAWFLVFALPFAVIPPAAFAFLLRASDRKWTISLASGEEIRKIPYVKLGLIGGICGVCSAVCSLFFATEWSCFKGNSFAMTGKPGWS